MPGTHALRLSMEENRNSNTSGTVLDRREQIRNETNQIDLANLFKAICNNIRMILSVAILCAVGIFLVSTFVIEPTYRSSFVAFVNNRTINSDNTQSLQSGDINASQNLTYTYASIIKSRPLIEEALQKAGLDDKYSYNDVSGSIATDIEQNTQLLSVYVTTKSADESYQLANALASIAPNYIANIVEGSSMKVVTSPIKPTYQYSPNVTKNSVIGFLIGLLVMIFIVVIRNLIDTKIKDAQELETRFDLSIIGTIPNYKQATKKHGYYYQSANRRKE